VPVEDATGRIANQVSEVAVANDADLSPRNKGMVQIIFNN
jgi:hypothetical protein